MIFDAATFLAQYADAYNSRDVSALRQLFALGDPRFTVFEEFYGDLICGGAYESILESAGDAVGRMSFQVLTCGTFGSHALLHAIQKIEEPGEARGLDEFLTRVSMCIDLSGERPRIVSAHFSSMLLCFPKPGSIFHWRKSA